MTAKSPYSDPLPGDRFARRLVAEINRSIGSFLPERDDAIDSHDERLIRQANQTWTVIEQTANELITLATKKMADFSKQILSTLI